jgi:hypothetical protein
MIAFYTSLKGHLMILGISIMRFWIILFIIKLYMKWGVLQQFSLP